MYNTTAESIVKQKVHYISKKVLKVHDVCYSSNHVVQLQHLQLQPTRSTTTSRPIVTSTLI